MERIAKKLVLASLITILTTAWPVSTAGEDAVPTTGFVDVDGGRLYYEEVGEGPAVVLLHDGLLPSGTWDEVEATVELAESDYDISKKR